jgi:hypothetical protein
MSAAQIESFLLGFSAGCLVCVFIIAAFIVGGGGF